MRRCVEEAAIIATMEKEPRTTCFITLTSPIMRDENLAEGGNKRLWTQERVTACLYEEHYVKLLAANCFVNFSLIICSVCLFH